MLFRESLFFFFLLASPRLSFFFLFFSCFFSLLGFRFPPAFFPSECGVKQRTKYFFNFNLVLLLYLLSNSSFPNLCFCHFLTLCFCHLPRRSLTLFYPIFREPILSISFFRFLSQVVSSSSLSLSASFPLTFHSLLFFSLTFHAIDRSLFCISSAI